jgi:hypothetical protein
VSTPTIQLAATEGRRFVRNPLIWLSFAPSVLWARSVLRSGDVEDELFLLVGYGLVLPGFVMIVAVVLATLRSRYERSEELLGTLAVGPDRRSIAHAGSTLALAAIGALATAAFIAALRPGNVLGRWSPSTGDLLDVPRPNVAQVLQGPVAIVTVATFVIALVRWVPSWLVLGPLLFLLMVQGLFMGIFHGTPTDGGRWLFPVNTGIVNGDWTGCAPEDSICDLDVSGFDRITPWWHIAYLAAASTWFTTIAVLRHRRDRTTWAWCAGTSAVLLICGSIQVAVAQEYVA